MKFYLDGTKTLKEHMPTRKHEMKLRLKHENEIEKGNVKRNKKEQK
jgi:hypothetical protein